MAMVLRLYRLTFDWSYISPIKDSRLLRFFLQVQVLEDFFRILLKFDQILSILLTDAIVFLFSRFLKIQLGFYWCPLEFARSLKIICDSFQIQDIEMWPLPSPFSDSLGSFDWDSMRIFWLLLRLRSRPSFGFVFVFLLLKLPSV